MRVEAPEDLDQLCADLGIGLKRRAKLAAKHGEGLVPYLQGLWRWSKRRDGDRFLARQNGLRTPEQYVSSRLGALANEDVPCVRPDIQQAQSVAARARFAALREAETRRLTVDQLSAKLRALQKRAERTGVDLSDELARVGKALAEAEAKLPRERSRAA